MLKTISILGTAALLLALSPVGSPADAATIGGSVTTAEGRAVPGAIVIIQQVDVPRGQRPFAARIQAGRNGVFVFERVPGGRFVVGTQSRLGSDRENVAVRRDGAARVRLVLGGGGNRVGGDNAPRGNLEIGRELD